MSKAKIAYRHIIALVKRAAAGRARPNIRAPRDLHFVDQPGTDTAKEIPDGGYSLDLLGVESLAAPIHPAYPTRMRFSYELAIWYRASIGVNEMSEAMAEDYVAIVKTLGNPDTWEQPTTGIIDLGYGEPMFVANVDAIDGGRVLKIPINCEVDV